VGVGEGVRGGGEAVCKGGQPLKWTLSGATKHASMRTPLHTHIHEPAPGAPPARSTLVGDIAEVKAVKQVFADTKHIKMNATKSLIGHCLGAAGGMEAIAVIKVRPLLLLLLLLLLLAYEGGRVVVVREALMAIAGICCCCWCLEAAVAALPLQCRALVCQWAWRCPGTPCPSHGPCEPTGHVSQLPALHLPLPQAM